MKSLAVTGPFGLSAELSEREQAGLLRSRVATDGASGGRLKVGGGDYLNFSANDYLGLADHPAIKAAFQEGIDRYGAGAGASPLVTGYSRAHQQLEETLAEWLGLEAVLLFNCGFSANQAVLKALLGKDHLLWQDKLNHASLQEMGSQLPCKMKRFGHNDMAALERQLEPNRGLIVSEGVFSMDGDQGPWRELSQLAARSGNWLMIDDAHGLGVLGPQGRGTLAAQGVNPAGVHIQMGTFGKALGVAGAFVGGSRELVAYLVNFARHYVYSTHMPAAQACAVRQSIALVRAADEARAHLGELITRFRQGAQALGWQLGDSNTPIQPLLVGESSAALQLAERLRGRGVWVSAIRPPTVPVGTARLRITLSAAHRAEDVDRLLDALGPCQAIDERGGAHAP
ncbi:8-amino-7-oxononanoate synthase [Aeromonas dhakensis]|uniref:8-amino-7-oxononanoate synthase n=1 Tax=Aeromonas dhakensis TaxID=196024 RepID=UPI0011170CC1|nr:8-amino-7-oxononanoate synthase [Aeromonas dhakensis]MBL0532408.1 8-amino-7-oxononanoate synthase [Aeromonas dhakensis]TNI26046.1 8-amino-7-oxononanoate synthase [Aeromonas dhakensis]TNI43943.1 8-amino-7-oxononanoate synthase [Aeromonas dhakensis]